MSEIGFYHLTRSSAEQALPRLLGRTLDLGKRALVLVRDDDRAAAIDDALWRAPEPVWLPHGTARLGHAALQPVWIEAAASLQAPGARPPNDASFLFLLDAVEAPIAGFERVFDLFDGGDEAAVSAARLRWTRLKQAGHGLTYWRQEASGWHQATRHAATGSGQAEGIMQDDTRQHDKPVAPRRADTPPASQEQMNRPGLTNGVPDQAGEAEPKASPRSDRHETETGAGRAGSGT